MSETPAIEFTNVSFAYPGGARALEDVSFSVTPGERVGVLGPNGAGKSTLVKLALGVLDGHSGTIRVFGSPPHVARKRGDIGYVPQRSEAALDFPLSARQVAALGVAHRVSPLARLRGEQKDAIDEAIEVVGATPYANKPVGSLSGGQLQRVFIARALACRPRILALDEPLVGVDVTGQQRFGALLTDLHERLGVTIVVVSHDIRAIAASCDRVLCLARKMHWHASPEGLTPAVLAEVFEHDVAGALGEVHVEAHLAEECPGGHVHTHGASGSVASEPDDATARD